jgi:mono/diheme cytochrome c family protein
VSASPYRDRNATRSGTFVRLRYRPCVGVWPVVLALAVAVPLAIIARRDARTPTVVSCTTFRAPGNDKMCSDLEPDALGAVTPIRCGAAPAVLEKALSPSNPFVHPIISATRTEISTANPACGETPGASNVVLGGNVFVNGIRISSNDAPPAGPAPPPAAPPAGSGGVDAATARSYMAECALHPSWSGPIKTVSVSVLERDYLPSVLVVAGALALAFLGMRRRRATVDLDGAEGTLRLVEHGFFRVRRRAALPLAEVLYVTVATGAGPLLNGKRVEVVCRNGDRLPLVDAFVPLTWRAHDQMARRLAFELNAPHVLPAPSRLAKAAVAFASLATVAAAGTGILAWHAYHHRPPRSVAPARLARAGEVRDGSTIVLASLGARKLALVADVRIDQLRAVDAPTLFETGETRGDVFDVKLASPPGAMVMDGKGRLFVAMPRESAIAVYAQASPVPGLSEIARIPTEAEPIDVSLTPDEATLVVLCNWGHALETFRSDTFARSLDVALPRSPSALALAADGKRAYVAHDTGSVLTTVDLSTGGEASTSLDIENLRPGIRGTFGPTGTLPLLHARLARVEGSLYVPGDFVSTGDPNAPPSPSYYGNGSINGGFNVWQITPGANDAHTLTARVGPRVTTDRGRIVPPRSAPSANMQPQSCLLPRVALADPAGQWLFVACEGPGRVFKIDISPSARGYCGGGWLHEYAVGDDPTGMALDEEGRTLLVWSPDSERITAFPLDPTMIGAVDPPKEWVTELRAPERDARAALLHRGRDLFYDTHNRAISGDGTACASCHVDGRDDALTWPTKLGPRQTPMLAGRLAGTAPYGWSGLHADLRSHLTETFERLNAQETLPRADEDALVAYIQSIPPPPATITDTASVERGRTLFDSAQTGCSGCHTSSDGTFTDTERHDVHSRARGDHRNAFDTPSLLYVGGSGPYFHDGRYATLRQLVDGVDGKMGHTKQLSDAEKDDLVHYLESIGASRPDHEDDG